MNLGRQRQLLPSVPQPGCVLRSSESRKCVLPRLGEREYPHFRFGSIEGAGEPLRWFDCEWRPRPVDGTPSRCWRG